MSLLILVARVIHMTILKKVRDFLQETKNEFHNSGCINFSECVLVFGNESTGTIIPF